MGPTSTTATKRQASRSPSERSAKRHAASSPEEGEVDDSGSPSQGPSLPTPTPVISQNPTSNLPPKPKVAFPFKKKGGPSSTRPILPAFDSNGGPASYVRSAEDEEKLSSRYYDSNRRAGYRDQRGERRNASTERRRRYSPRHAAPRDAYHRSKSRSPRSHRSRSPGSPYRQEKHRLPPPRTPPSNLSPANSGHSRAAYDLDDYERRWQPEASRGYGRREDDRHYRPGPTRPDDHRLDYRRDDRDRDYHRGRDHDRRRWDDAPQRRPFSPPLQTPPQPPSHSVLLPPQPAGGLPPQPPTSPPPQPPPDSRLMTKDVTLPEEHKSVSIPLKRPPPLPSHDAHPQDLSSLMVHKRDEETKTEDDGRREEERIDEERKRAEDRQREEDRKGAEGWNREEDRKKEEERKREERKREERKREDERKRAEGWQREEKKEAEPPKVRPIRKREIIRRNVDDEFKAYGRKFVGCGAQSDYDITTKLGEGTFGEVHKAIQKKTRRIVALKRILMHNEKEGMPVTALREIKILKALNHPSIVEILDMFVTRSTAKDPLSVYMVFPYMDHDLAGLLENERAKLSHSQIKLYMKQLLEGTEYMHRNHILHRDMKAANLLISNDGSLRIADFGLARSYSYETNSARVGSDGRVKERRYTNCVVTRWYRPPELLLGARQYGGEVDIWGIGCVLGEMFNKRPILAGNSDLDQLEKIWQLCGTPNQHTWPNFDALPGCEGIKRFTPQSRRVKLIFASIIESPETIDLFDKLLTCNPRERITAADALDHDYFWTDPLPADPKTLPSYEASHEFDKRSQRNQQPPPMPQHPAHMPRYNFQNVSRGPTGQDPGRNAHNNNNNNRNMPYPGPPHSQPPYGHGHGPPHPHHGPPGGPHHGPPPSNFNPDYRNRPHPPPNQRYNNSGPGGGGRGPPPFQQNHSNSQNDRACGRPGDVWAPNLRPPHPSHLPSRPPAPQGGHPHSKDQAGRGNSRPPLPPSGGDKLNYD